MRLTYTDPSADSPETPEEQAERHEYEREQWEAYELRRLVGLEQTLRAALKTRHVMPAGPGGRNGSLVERRRCRALVAEIRSLRELGAA